MSHERANRLLSALSRKRYEQLVSRGQLERLEIERELATPGAATEQVCFPAAGGVVSLVTTMETGDSIECLVVGNEGVVGFWLALGLANSPWTAIVQVEGEGWMMERPTFTELLREEPEFRREMLAYCGRAMVTTSQSVACNRFHDLTSRTARWLLLIHDRVGDPEFTMTHAFMGLMLGVHRPAVTVALRTLSSAGIIEQRARARLAILDRRALENAACECYEVTSRLEGR